jgi:hypothetical protein
MDKGPSEVLRLAEKQSSRPGDSDRAAGVRAALSWALGKREEHPITNQNNQGNKRRPPDMGTIAKVAHEAKVAAKRPSHWHLFFP